MGTRFLRYIFKRGKFFKEHFFKTLNKIIKVHFANVVFLEPVEGVDFSLKRRSRLNCLVCKRKKVGACLQCSSVSFLALLFTFYINYNINAVAQI